MRSPSPPRGLNSLPKPPPRREPPRYRDDSPPYRSYDRPRQSFHAESSRSYNSRDTRDRDSRDVHDARDYRESRDSRDRDRDRPWSGSGSYRERNDDYRNDDRRVGRRESRSPQKLAIRRSGSPEEGQITSPAIPAPLPRRRSRSPLPLRRRSPSPPPRRRSPSPISHRRRSPSPRRAYYPPSSGGNNERDYRRTSPDRRSYRRTRSPSPVRRRDTSPSSISTRSSRHTSPRKRRPDSPDRRRSPERSLPNTNGTNGNLGSARPATRVPPNFGGVSVGRPFMPPSAPRSERLGLLGPTPGNGVGAVPTGPRALTNPTSYAPVRKAIPSGPREDLLAPTSTTSSSVSTPIQSQPVLVQVIKPSPPSGTPVSTSPTNRLSWSERKKVPPPPSSSSPPRPPIDYDSPNHLPPPQSETINPYAPVHQTSSPARPPTPSSMSSSRATDNQIPLPVPQTQIPTPPSQAVQETCGFENGHPQGVPSGPSRIVTDQEEQEMRLKDAEMRILAELPALKVPFGGLQWEVDLAKHYTSLQTTHQSLLRSQSLYRHAAAILADAEGERIAAMERRKIVEGQLGMGTIGGLLGV